ncbi:hypothetical protein TA3x_005537 [Tundrisphaera sp. TA3]|uniref:hypothetical protein n=1 Tax=Tundrisphaera sp. TA3 TaxID=3435775 RepID=UPI003EBF89B1
MSGRRARVLAIVMYVAAALCGLELVFKVVSAPALNPVLLIGPIVGNLFLAVVLILGARIVWEKGNAPGKVALTDPEWQNP